MSPVGPGVNFPIKIYDRPAMALGNLVLGDVDASTRAIFAPMSLTPDEMKTIRSMTLGKKGEQNPILKTAVDIATNPIVIAGLVMALGPWGKIAKPLELSKLMAEGHKFIKSNNEFMNALMSPQTAFRRLQGATDGQLWKSLMGVVEDTGMFQDKYQKMWTAALQKFKDTYPRALTRTDFISIDMYNRGFHTADAPLIKQWAGVFLDPKPLTPGLKAYLRKNNLLELAGNYKDILGKMKIDLTDDAGYMIGDISRKGVLPIEEHYGPRVLSKTPLERWISKAGGGEYKKRINKYLTSNGAAGLTRARKGNSIPSLDDLEEVKHLFDPEQYRKLVGMQSAQIPMARVRLQNMVDDIAEHIAKTGELPKSSDGNILTAVDKMLKGLGKKGDFSEMMKFTGLDAASRERMTQEVASKVISVAQGAASPAELTKLIDDVASLVGQPAYFTLNASRIMPAYIKAASPTFGWYAKGHGKTLDYIFDKKSLISTPLERANWEDGLKMMVRGYRHPKEWVRNMIFNDTTAKLYEWMGTPRARQMIPASLRKWFRDTLGGTKGYISDTTVGGQMAGLLYNSALSMNMSPVSKNLMQNFITTLNVLGPVPMVRGLRRVAAGLGKMAKMMPKHGMEEAFKKAFPEYSSKFVYEHIGEAMVAGDIAKEGQVVHAMAKGLKGGVHKALKVGMGPFTASEKFNRLLAFYSAHDSIIGKAGAQAAADFGRNITMNTQFTGGVVGLAQKTRGYWAPFRQFTHFPMRFIEFLYSTTRYGPGGQFTLGPLGRTMAGSAAAYTAAKNIAGIDISGGLAFSALPFPEYENSPFFPFPLVPPAVGMVGVVAKAVVTGEYDRVGGRVGALMVPGGLALRRGWRTFAPKYAGYDKRTPDGRIPVFNDKGMLIASQTPLQLALRGTGIRPSSIQAEQELTKYLMAQRDKIRDYRRNYLEALVENDLEKAQGIGADFQKQYPSLGPLHVKKGDIKTVQNRKEISRMRRVLKGFPKEYRPLFESLIEHSQLTQMAQDIDFNPSALQYYVD